MSNVTLTIGGRPYAVACAAGEESHIEALGRSIDGKISGIPSLAGQSEARTLLFAALLLADELHELTASGAATIAPASDLQTAESLEIAADRLESLADRLESYGS